MKRIAIICGSRETPTTYSVADELDKLHKVMPFEFVITGGAKGVDTDAKLWADHHDIRNVVHYADWKMYGRQAGPLRNVDMADLLLRLEANQAVRQCIAFPGGKGTENMIATAERYGIEVVRVVPVGGE